MATTALAPAAASAAPALNGTYTTTDNPKRLVAGPDGNIWYGQEGEKEFAKITPNGTITDYDTPTNLLSLQDVTAGPDTAGGPTNRLWFSYNGGVLEVDPATGTATEHLIPEIQNADGIAVDRNGNLWVVDYGAPTGIVGIKPNGAGVATLIEDVKVPSSGREVTLGSDGRMWWVDTGGKVHATLTEPPYTTTPVDVGGMPQGIAAGPVGQLGVTNPGTSPHTVMRLPIGGAPQSTPDPLADPFGITLANDGAYWIAHFNKATVGRLTPDGQFSEPIAIPPNAFTRWIATGPNDTLWLSGTMSKQILRITGVEPPPPPPPGGDPTPPPTSGGADTKAPVITAAKLNVARRRLRLTLDEAATLRLRIDQKRKGQRRGKKCRAIKRGQRPKRRCNYWKNRRSAMAAGVAGQNAVPLGRKLSKGSYRLVIRATDAAGNSTQKTIKFKVKPKRKKRK